MTIYIPFLVCIIGALLYGLTSGKLEAIGKDMFWTGLLVTLFQLTEKAVSILR